MILNLHPDIRIQKLSIGREQAPLLVIDSFVDDPDKLARRAAAKSFTPQSSYYPGIRAEAPLAYQQLFERQLKSLLVEFFELQATSFKFSMCHYSIVTASADRLTFLQRVPHIDSVQGSGLASVHYLFKRALGGTAFYRHRKTGFEYVDVGRRDEYFKTLEAERLSPDAPTEGYITGDTPLFEKIAEQDAIYNRVLIYRRNSLHCGSIPPEFIPDPNPLTGRLSVNCFIDPVG